MSRVYSTPVRDEFLRLVALETDECLPLVAAKSGGYPTVKWEGRTRLAPSLACELAHGARPAGLECAHSCGNQACVNKRHLRWTTHADNCADQIEHGTKMSGTSHPSSIITPDQVREMRRLHAEELMGVKEIGRRFGVNYSTVSNAIARRSWAHVDPSQPTRAQLVEWGRQAAATGLDLSTMPMDKWVPLLVKTLDGLLGRYGEAVNAGSLAVPGFFDAALAAQDVLKMAGVT